MSLECDIQVRYTDKIESNVRCFSHPQYIGHPLYTIVLNENDGKILDCQPHIVLAHEIGHVIAGLARMPGSIGNMPREAVMCDHDLMMQSERDAWDIAEDMMKYARKRALQTYEENSPSRQKPVFYAGQTTI